MFPVTPVAFPLPASEVLSPCTPPEMAVHSVNKAVPVENPLETSVPVPEIDSLKEASIQATTDQSNGVAATQVTTKQTEEVGLVASPVSQQGATADPVGDSAGLLVSEECTPSVENPVASSKGDQVDEDAVPPKVAQSQELVVATEESISQDKKQIPFEVKASEDKSREVAEKNPYEPKHCAPVDVIVTTEDGIPSDSSKTTIEDPRSLGLDPAEDQLLPGDLNVNVAIQNVIPEKEEPVVLLSKAIQSKGASKCEGPPLSTRPLSGWFIFCEEQVFPNLMSWSFEF